MKFSPVVSVSLPLPWNGIHSECYLLSMCYDNEKWQDEIYQNSLQILGMGHGQPWNEREQLREVEHVFRDNTMESWRNLFSYPLTGSLSHTIITWYRTFPTHLAYLAASLTTTTSSALPGRQKFLNLWRMDPKKNLEVFLRLHITDNYHVPCPCPIISLHNCPFLIKYKHSLYRFPHLCIFISEDSFATHTKLK